MTRSTDLVPLDVRRRLVSVQRRLDKLAKVAEAGRNEAWRAEIERVAGEFGQVQRDYAWHRSENQWLGLGFVLQPIHWPAMLEIWMGLRVVGRKVRRAEKSLAALKALPADAASRPSVLDADRSSPPTA